jgi:large subunit ribosomal protein L17
MRHRVRKYLKFKKKDFQHRKAMERNLLTSFFLHKSIKTTEKKAKAVVPMIDKLINVANTKDEMNAIRQVMQYLYTKESSLELFKNIAPKYKDKKTSGFTRITPIKYRDGDNAKLVLLELI